MFRNRLLLSNVSHNIVRSRLYSQRANVPKSRRFLKFSGVTLGLGVAGYSWDRYYNSSTLSRSVYALYTLAWVGYEYYRIEKYEDPDVLHEIASEAIYKMIMANKGMYIKIGQAIANQGSVFPMAFQKRFVKLYDEAPHEPWNLVDECLKKTYGSDYETAIFNHIDHDPIASASIAQVHRAELKNGDQVAVKIQHDYISEQVPADMMTYTIIVKVYERLFDIPMGSYAKYVAEQTIKETDFINEYNNAETFRKFLDNDPSVKNLGIYVPKNYPEYVKKKVLISEWIDGIPLTDKKILIDSDVNLTTVMHQFIKIFGQQIFKYGFVHCDPHPGNLLVRTYKGKQQLVILDHGLYVNMSDKFRKEYSLLWKYLFAFDREGIRKIGEEWGIKSIDMFATTIQLKPANPDKRIPKSKSQKELLKEFLSDSSKIPFDLFFLGRTMRIIQTCNKNLGSPINRINTLTDSALDTLIVESGFREYLNLLKLKVSLFVSTVVFWWFRLRQILNGDRYGYKGLGLEDKFEKYFKDMAKDMGVNVVVNDEIK